MIATVDWASVACALAVLFITSRIIAFYKARKELSGIPTLACLASPVSAVGALSPTSRSEPGRSWQWAWRSHVYRDAGSETIAFIPYLFGSPVIYTSSLEVARQVVSTKGQFFKSRDMSEITLIWGDNIFAANGDDWRRHRRIITPAFSTETYKSVWRETAKAVDQMVSEEGWSDKGKVEVPVINELTNKLALILISTCGFGNELDWKFSKSPSEAMSFGDALTIISRRMLARLVLPQWAYSLPSQFLRDTETAYSSLKTFMQNLIGQRRQELASTGSTGKDVLSLMIQSSEAEKFSMDDSELLGNTFILLFAGHDTTAHALDAALAFLALHESFQDEVYDEILQVMPTDADFTFENSSRLTKTRACFLEAARLFPAGFMMIRDTTEDMVLQNLGPNLDQTLPLKRGTRVVVDMVGLHYNPRLFPDPEAFKPERWYDAHENDLTMFSVGSRACIGRKFAITEGVSFLARLLKQWRVEILAKEGESKEQWKERVMQGRIFMTLGVGDVPIRLVRRG